MQKITTIFEKQQKRIQQITTRWKRKGYSITKIKKEVAKRYGVTVADVGLTYDKKTGIFRKKKLSKKQEQRMKEKYKTEKVYKNDLYRESIEKAKKKIADAYAKKYTNKAYSNEEIVELAKKWGYKNYDWEHMTLEEYYKALDDFTKFAIDFVNETPEEDFDTLTDLEVELYTLGLHLLGRSPLGI